MNYVKKKWVNSNWNILSSSIESIDISELGESGEKLKHEITDIKETINQNSDILSTIDNAEKLNN